MSSETLATPPYTGNSDYCYSNSLHMCLLGAGYDPAKLPSPSFIECLTTQPFGKLYVTTPNAPPAAYFSNPSAHPEEGLTLAINALGWRCQRRSGGDPDAAMVELRSAVRTGPVLAGPLDMGHLRHNPIWRHVAGADHFVAVLEIDDAFVTIHDPAKYPFARVPIADFAEAWKAERVDYAEEGCVMRHGFRPGPRVLPSRTEMIARTLEVVRRQLRDEQQIGPVFYGGVKALELARDAVLQAKQSVIGPMAHFTIPLLARRALDAALFLREGEQCEAADAMLAQAKLCGAAMFNVANSKDYNALRGFVGDLIPLERQFEGAILKG